MIFLPENLKKYRILKNLTQEDVVGYLGITYIHIHSCFNSYTDRYSSKRLERNANLL